MKKITFALIVFVLLSLALSACSAGLAQTPAATQVIAPESATQTPYVVVVTATPLPETPAPTATLAPTSTVVPTTTRPVFMSIVINGQGTNSPMIWNQPLEAGQMVGPLGTIYYTQSGKDGVQTVTGSLISDQYLVVDAFRLDFNGKSYTDGVILVIPGPVENLVPLTITNGAIQTISKNDLQNLLDTNIWVKFCRGDKNKAGTAWSYQKWALTTTILPEGFTFKDYGKCFNATNDIYPNNPPQ